MNFIRLLIICFFSIAYVFPHGHYPTSVEGAHVQLKDIGKNDLVSCVDHQEIKQKTHPSFKQAFSSLGKNAFYIAVAHSHKTTECQLCKLQSQREKLFYTENTTLVSFLAFRASVNLIFSLPKANKTAFYAIRAPPA